MSEERRLEASWRASVGRRTSPTPSVSRLSSSLASPPVNSALISVGMSQFIYVYIRHSHINCTTSSSRATSHAHTSDAIDGESDDDDDDEKDELTCRSRFPELLTQDEELRQPATTACTVSGLAH